MSDLLEGVQQEAQAIRKGYTPQQSGLLSAVDQEAQAIRVAEERKRAFMYGIPMSDSDYEIISQGIAESSNPDEERWNWGAALMYSQRLGIDVSTAKQNLEGISSAWMANPMNYKGKSHFEAIVDSFRAGDIQMEAADIAKRWRDGGGADVNIERRLDELYGEMEKLQDHWPRNIAVEILKAGAQTAPFMVQTIGSGAMAAGAATLAIGALGGTAATGGIAAPVGAAATAAALKAFAFSAGSFMASFSKMSALEYYEMRKQGISHDVANTWSTVSGGAQAMIETALGNVPGLIGKVGGETVTSISGKIAKKLFLSGKWGAAARAIMSYGGEVVEEGVEEALQSIVSDVSKNIAAGLEEKGIPQTEAADIAKNAVEQFKGGALAAVGMGLPGAFIGYKQAARQSKALSELAQSMDKDDFIYEASKWEGVAEMPEKERKAALSSLWDSQQKRKAQEAEKAPGDTTEADIEVEGDDVEETDVRRTKEGTIRTEIGDQRTNADGSTTAIVKAGEPDAPGRYGYARYTIDGDTVKIESVKVKESIKDKAEVRRALVLEIAAQNPGLNIEWETKSEENQAVKDRIIRENPKGANAGLQWYGADEKPHETRTRHKFRADILSTFKSVSTEQADAITALAERRASRVGLSLEDYRKKYIAGITTETPEGVLAAQKAGKKILGATVIRDGKALVYAAKNADFSTLAHEFMHVWENETRETGGEDLVALEKAFGIEHEKWTDADRERVAYTWEEFLRTGKAKTPELQNIFQKIAEWMVNIYRKISGQITISDEIAEALEGLFRDPGSPLSEAARTKAQESASMSEKTRQAGQDSTVFQYAGENAVLDDIEKQNLSVAKEMDAAGKDPETIRLATGWFKGKYDGKWRIELDDKAVVHVYEDRIIPGKPVPLSDVLQYPALYKKYPDLADIPVSTLPEYTTADSIAAIGEGKAGEKYLLVTPERAGNQWELSKIVLHEVQHLVQEKEGFARGSSPFEFQFDERKLQAYRYYRDASILSTMKARTGSVEEAVRQFQSRMKRDPEPGATSILDSYSKEELAQLAEDNRPRTTMEQYTNTAGEIEARDVESRYSLSPEQRRAIPPYSSENIAAEDAVVLFQYAGENAILDDIEKQNLSVAKEMDAAGKDAETIRLATGWFKGKYDGKWRIETMQGKVLDRDEIDSWGTREDMRTGNRTTAIIGKVYDSPEVYAKYPDIAGIIVRLVPDAEGGGYYPGDNLISVGYDRKSGKINAGTLYHEIQHVIQGIEGFAKGGSPTNSITDEYRQAKKRLDEFDHDITHNPQVMEYLDPNNKLEWHKAHQQEEWYQNAMRLASKWRVSSKSNAIAKGKQLLQAATDLDPLSTYTRTAGEIEARDIEARMALTPEQRRAIPPYSSENIAAEDAVVLFQEAEAAFTSALDKFGETKSVYEAGYVLPDGRMVDLSGRNQATGYTKKGNKYVPDKDDYLKNERSVDHREIKWDGVDKNADGNERMEAFIGMGAIRIDANSGLADMSMPPTPKQWAIIKTIIESSGTAWVEMRDGKRTASIEADGNPTKALGYIRRFYNGENFEETIVFQSEDALRDEARTFDTWREFMEYVEATDSQEDKAVESLPQDEREKWYRDFWKAAQAEKQKPLSPQEADERFTSRIETNDGLDDFLAEINNVLTFTVEDAPQDPEEQAYYEKRLDLQKRIKAMHPTVLNNATRVGLGRPITDRARAAIETLMKSGATYYRRLYAEIMDDASLQNVDKEQEAQALPRIEDPEEAKDWEAASIVNRVKIAKAIKNAEIKKRLMSGEIVPEKEMQEVIAEQDAKIAELEATVKVKEAEIADDYKTFTTHEKTFVEQKARIKELSDDLAKTERTIARLVERGQAVSEALTSARQEAALQLKSAKAQLAAVRATERTKAREAKQAAIDKTKAQIKKAQEKRAEARKVLNYKKSLANQIMRPTTVAISYDKRVQIEALQSMLDPHLRHAQIKWRGETYRSYLGILETLRENPDLLKDSALEKKILDRLIKKPLNEWTIEELEKLNDEIQRLRDQGIQEWAAVIQERKAAAIRSASAIASQAFKSGKYEEPAAAGSAERAQQIKRKNSLWRQVQMKTLNAARIANLLDGGKDRENTRLLVKESREAYAEKMHNLDRRAAPIMEALEKAGYKGDTVAERAKELWERKYTIDKVGPDQSSVTLTADDLMYIAIALKDEHSRAAILYGNLASEKERLMQDEMALTSWGMTKEQILRDAIKKHLTAADMEIVDAIQEDYTREFGRLNNLFIEEFNVAMKQVGFYVPLVRETTASMDTAHEKQQAEEVLNVGGISIRRNPDKGFTHERVKIGPKNQRAVKLGLVATWLTAVEREEHFHAYTPYIRNLNRVYKSNSAHSRQVRDAIVNTYGTEAFKYIENYMNEQANPKSFADAGLNKLVRGLRGDLGSAYLGWKLSGVVKQLITSPIPYSAYVSPLAMVRSAFTYMGNVKAFDDFIRERSAIMRHRVQNPVIQVIKEGLADPKASQKFAQFKEIGIKGLEIADWVSVAIGWRSAYDSAIAKGQTEKEAIEYADDVTLKCQPSARPEDLAPLFKTGSEFTRAFTQFQSALNVIWNQVSYDIPVAFKNKQFGYAFRQIASYVVAGILLGIVTRGKEDDDDTKADDFLYWSMTQFTDSVPLIGSQVNSLWRQVSTGEKSNPYASPLMPALDESINAMRDITEGDWGGAAKNFAEGVGLFLGAPVSGVKEVVKTVQEGPGALVGRRRK